MAQQNDGVCPSSPGDTQRKTRRIVRWVAIGIAGVFAVAGMVAVFGLLVQWLWNTVVADILSVKQIAYLQALGLIVLARLLFGVFSLNRGGRRSTWRARRPQGEEGEAAVEPDVPAPMPGDFERYWQEEGRTAFAAYLQKQEQARQQAKAE